MPPPMSRLALTGLLLGCHCAALQEAPLRARARARRCRRRVCLRAALGRRRALRGDPACADVARSRRAAAGAMRRHSKGPASS